jgi:hypothetical protein
MSKSGASQVRGIVDVARRLEKSRDVNVIWYL